MMKSILSLIILITNVSLADCPKGELCHLDIPGIQCADGSPSFVKYIDRGSEHLFMYVQGGGACFDAVTCGCRLNEQNCKGSNEGGKGALAGYLSRPPVDEQTHPWSRGEDHPIGKANYFEIIYCTGDVYTGAGVANYGNKLLPRLVRHVGGKNFELSTIQAKNLFPNVKKVTVVGSSAGGVGISYNLHHIAKQFEGTEISVINDSGIPIFGRFLDQEKVRGVLKNWNVTETIPKDMNVDGDIDFEEIYSYNATKLAHVRYGLIGALEDAVFAVYFNLLGGSSDSVAKSLQEAGKFMHQAQEHHYFFDHGKWHTATFLPSYGVPKALWPQSQGIYVYDWLKSMVSGSKDWSDVEAD